MKYVVAVLLIFISVLAMAQDFIGPVRWVNKVPTLLPTDVGTMWRKNDTLFLQGTSGIIKMAAFEKNRIDSIVSAITSLGTSNNTKIAKTDTNTIVLTISDGKDSLANVRSWVSTRLNGISDSLRIAYTGPAYVNLTSTVINWTSSNSFHDTLLSGYNPTYSFANTPTTYRKSLRVGIFNKDGLSTIDWADDIHWTGDHSIKGKDTLTIYQFTSDAPGVVSGMLVEHYFFGTEVAPNDTTHPSKPAIQILSLKSDEVIIGWLASQSGNTEKDWIIKRSSSPIGEVAVYATGDTVNYPVLTKQSIVASPFQASSLSMTVTLPQAVDPSLSWHSDVTYEGSYSDPNLGLTVELSADGTSLIFRKLSSVKGYTITNMRVRVFTLSKWIKVYHLQGSFTTSSSELNLTIPQAVSLTHAAPLASVSFPGTDTKGWNFPLVELTSTTNLRIKLSGNSGGTVAPYASAQVLVLDSATVQSVDFTMGTGATDTVATTALGTKVKQDSTWTIFSYRATSLTTGITDISTILCFGWQPTDSTFKAKRIKTGTGITGKAYLVTFSARWPVLLQQLLFQLSSSEYKDTVTFTSSEMDRSIIMGQGYLGRTGITSATVDSIISNTFSVLLIDSVKASISRGSLGFSNDFRAQHMLIPEGATEGTGTDTLAFNDLPAISGSYVTTFDPYISFRIPMSPNTDNYVAVKSIGQNDSISALSNVLFFHTPTVTLTNNGKYFVDGTSGSDDSTGLTTAKAFKTVQKAIDLAVEGDTIRVKGVVAPFTLSRANSEYIVIKQYPDSMPTINFGSVKTGNGISINNASHWVIDGFRILAGARAISGLYSNNVIIKNSYFYDQWGYASIYMNACSDWTINNNTIDLNARSKVVAPPANQSYGSNGIWITWSNDGSNPIQSYRNYIHDNEITWANHSGLTIASSSRYTSIKNNILHGNKIGLTIGYTSRNNTVEGNFVYDSQLYGFNAQHGGDAIHITCDSSRVRYNTFIRGDTTIYALASPYLVNIYSLNNESDRCSAIRFTHNTVFNKVSGYESGTYRNVYALSVVRNDAALSDLYDIKIMNSIFVGHDSTIMSLNNTLKTESEALQMSRYRFFNNNFVRTAYTTGKPITRVFAGALGTATTRTLSALQIAYPSYVNDNVEVDPGFTNSDTWDFTLKSDSQLKDIGDAEAVATNSGTNVVNLDVDDPVWFSDGAGSGADGAEDIGDLITLNSKVFRIIKKVGSTLTLSDKATWVAGDKVYLGSDSTPNIGRY